MSNKHVENLLANNADYLEHFAEVTASEFMEFKKRSVTALSNLRFCADCSGRAQFA